MKRLIPILLCLCLVMAFAATDSHADDQQPFFVHFVVISKTMPNGLDFDAAVLSFKEEVIKLAGGYTDLGPTRGGSLNAGNVKHRDNLSFIIGAKKDVSVELKKMTKRLFGGDGAFILAWPGKVLF